MRAARSPRRRSPPHRRRRRASSSRACTLRRTPGAVWCLRRGRARPASRRSPRARGALAPLARVPTSAPPPRPLLRLRRPAAPCTTPRRGRGTARSRRRWPSRWTAASRSTWAAGARRRGRARPGRLPRRARVYPATALPARGRVPLRDAGRPRARPVGRARPARPAAAAAPAGRRPRRAAPPPPPRRRSASTCRATCRCPRGRARVRAPGHRAPPCIPSRDAASSRSR